VKKRHEFARTVIGQVLDATQEDPGVCSSGPVAMTAVMNADSCLV
jgi:hypothetical protein